tara:strand:+ start:2968 stop:3798 length:831 start_codon:yes stop_codon:yes gene_type:complete
MKKVCTLFLQRNLPEITNTFGDHFLKWNEGVSDFYVIESGSDTTNLSKFTNQTFHANWEDVTKNGLRTGRGFNYGLLELNKLSKDYEFICMIVGDAQLYDEPTIEIMLEEMLKFPRMSILSPMESPHGLEFNKLHGTKAYNHFPHVAWMVRSDFIKEVSEEYPEHSYMQYFYDGTNFRVYDADTELILKSYQKNWFTAITRKCTMSENDDVTYKNVSRMKTDTKEQHQSLMWEEGMRWLKTKYGFNNKHQMRELVRREYFNFFERNPNLKHLRLPV